MNTFRINDYHSQPRPKPQTCGNTFWETCYNEFHIHTKVKLTARIKTLYHL